ncbi:MAG: band 7 protein [Planctomycetales bacterium]|nr:band 7 protein [Planctomycetales bacterium]
MNKRLITAITVLGMGACGLFAMFHWNVNRFYVPEGYSLMLRYKGPLIFGARDEAPAGHFAENNQIGIREQLCGPGRHFYCPIWWERTLVPDQVVQPHQVAIVTSKMGDALPSGEYLVDGGLSGENRATHKGILRKVFGPGRYRANPYAFEFNIIDSNQGSTEAGAKGWVEIPTGYVGVVTYLAANKAEGHERGIQDEVLPPGLYPINPREITVDIVEIGFRETSITVDKVMKQGKVAHDESGEPVAVADSGIGFPSNDGFDIQLDFTAIWGVMPAEAPEVIRTFGTIEEAERKVILPQSESICRNNGSKMSAVELLVGNTRQQFQIETSTTFKNVLADKGLTLLYGLVRHIYIPREVRVPIQEGYIADELKLTREEEKLTAKTQADLKEAEKKVELESERVTVETEKLVANAIAEGERQAREIEAETARKVAEVDKQIAELDAKREVLLGQAEATAMQLQEEAKAQKFDLAVQAFGTPDAYNKWEFAEGLPENMDLKLFYAGEGTLWTDLNGVMPTFPVNAKTKAK